MKEYIGDSVKVHGKISGVEYSANSKQKSMPIYVGEKYPKQALTIFISPDVLNKLHIVPSAGMKYGMRSLARPSL